ncbi:NADH-quinone oxidoreductase subunit C [Streptomyces sp. NPDC093808]|uniref:NADH-quinone oxidoreductase subunit C n=1 Tax=Streptomyces sp. NPDC093808 TaxID=3154985 RepID=UPI0034505666
MTTAGWLPADVEELFGAQATAEEAYDVLTVDVPSDAWIPALEAARDRLGCTFFDWLSAVDEPGTGFRVTAHVAALAPVRRLLLRTTVPHEAPVLPSAVDVYAGAAWHERETHEMFGVDFTGHPGLDHLLLPDGFEGHPLRKDFVLAARVAKAWPGAKEPGESEHGGPKRRQMLPPGVPDPNEWGPLKGRLPSAPARPARRTATAAARTPGERPPRRTRSASEGSASQTAGAGTGAGADAGADARETQPPVTPRRARSVSEGSASQRSAGGSDAGAGAGAGAGEGGAQPPVTPRRARSVSEGSASQRSAGGSDAGAGAGEGGAQPPVTPRRARSASEGSVSQRSAGGSGAGAGTGEGGAQPPVTPRRARSASEGSASQRAETPARRSRSASEGSASQRAGAAGAGGPRRARSASEGSASRRAAQDQAQGADDTAADAAEERRDRKPPVAPRSPDAPWHHARPAFEEPEPEGQPERDSGARPGDTGPGPDPDPDTHTNTPDDPSGGTR